jgi:hypothetical protein
LPRSGQSRCLWPQHFSMRGRSATAARSPKFRAPTPRAPPGRSSRGTTQNRAAMQPGPGLPPPPARPPAGQSGPTFYHYQQACSLEAVTASIRRNTSTTPPQYTSPECRRTAGRRAAHPQAPLDRECRNQPLHPATRLKRPGFSGGWVLPRSELLGLVGERPTVKLGGEPNQDRRHGRATVTGPMPPPILTPQA